MGRWWHDKEAWNDAIEVAQPVLAQFERSLNTMCLNNEGVGLCQTLTKPLAQWLADASAWFFAMVSATMLMGWVVPKGVAASKARGRNGSLANKASWHSRMEHAISEGSLPHDVIAKCIRWLRPAGTQPAARLVISGQEVDAESSHQAWCEQVKQQTCWPYEYDMHFHNHLEHLVSTRLGRQWTMRGSGSHDAPVQAIECCRAIAEWDVSFASTPDLIPRILLKLDVPQWRRVVWLLIRLTGPGCLALRPLLWRGACAVPLHKKGPATSNTSFRLIMVKCQMGLLQEAVIFNRAVAQVRPAADFKGGGSLQKW